MNNEEFLREEFVKNALYRFDESTRMVIKSLAEVSADDLWRKPNGHLNSIANLILHVCGNITQYVISSVGETEDLRNRNIEFSQESGYSKEDLLRILTTTVDTAKRVVFDASTAQLVRIRLVQGFSLSGIGAIMHAVEHYSYHTGQIAFWVKFLKAKDLGFYDGLNLNLKNN